MMSRPQPQRILHLPIVGDVRIGLPVVDDKIEVCPLREHRVQQHERGSAMFLSFGVHLTFYRPRLQSGGNRVMISFSINRCSLATIFLMDHGDTKRVQIAHDNTQRLV